MCVRPNNITQSISYAIKLKMINFFTAEVQKIFKTIIRIYE